MPTPLPTSSTQGSVLPALIELIEIDADTEQFRYISSAYGDSAIQFQNQDYQPASISFKGYHAQSIASSPTPLLIIASAPSQLSRMAFSDRLRGQYLTRKLTFDTELDPPHGTGSGAHFEAESWQIDRVMRLDGTSLQLKLVPPVYLEEKQLPYRVLLRDICQHSYRRWDAGKAAFDYQGISCPYTGNEYFNEQGNRVSDPAADACSLRLTTGCKKRFSGALPYFGFPGLV